MPKRNMGFDYDGTIQKLKQFKREDEEKLDGVVAAGHVRLAESVRRSIATHEECIAGIEAIRDEQSS